MNNAVDWGSIFSKLRTYLDLNNLPSVNQLAENRPYEALISTLISLRTKDKVTLEASNRLFEIYPDINSLADADQKKIEELIFPAGFFRVKAERLIKTANIIRNNFNSTIPSTLKDLLSLPGVGLKTANLTLAVGFGIEAICVDIHVHRICNRFGWIKTDNADQSEEELRKILPKKYWIPINTLLVNFGQKICTPASPWCSKCALYSNCSRKDVNRSR